MKGIIAFKDDPDRYVVQSVRMIKALPLPLCRRSLLRVPTDTPLTMTTFILSNPDDDPHLFEASPDTAKAVIMVSFLSVEV